MLPGVRDPLLAEQLPPLDDPDVAVPVEGEIESSRLSLEEEIDEFYFEEEVQQAPLIELSDPEEEQDRNSAVGALLIIACSVFFKPTSALLRRFSDSLNFFVSSR